MIFTTLELCKLNCRVESDNHLEDEWFKIAIDAAEEFALARINRTAREVLDTFGDYVPGLTAFVNALVAGSYAHREDSRPPSAGELGKGIIYLLQPYVKMI